MKVLFDQGTPVPLRTRLVRHNVATAFEQGWSAISNGDLLDAAETARFEVLVTTDQSLSHHQNLKGRSIAVVVLLSTSWPKIQLKLDAVIDAVDNAQTGTYVEVPI